MLESLVFFMVQSIVFMLRIVPTDSFPKPLSKDEERCCLERWEKGDVEARNTLVEHNMRLVAHIIKKYYTQTEDTDDLISIGTIGLIKGINTYKADKGVRLATYASRCIENEILMYFRSLKKSSGDISLSEALDIDGDGNGLSVLDVVAQSDDMSESIGSEELYKSLRNCVDSVLDEREALVIKHRYGLSGGKAKTQRETAKLCNISRSYVSRIEKKALEKLRAALGEDAYLV